MEKKLEDLVSKMVSVAKQNTTDGQMIQSNVDKITDNIQGTAENIENNDIEKECDPDVLVTKPISFEQNLRDSTQSSFTSCSLQTGENMSDKLTIRYGQHNT